MKRYSRKIIKNTIRHWRRILEAGEIPPYRMSEDQIIDEILQSDEFPNWAKAPYVVEWLAELIQGKRVQVKYNTIASGLNMLMSCARAAYNFQTGIGFYDCGLTKKRRRHGDDLIPLSINDDVAPPRGVKSEDFRYMMLTLVTRADGQQLIVFAPSDRDFDWTTVRKYDSAVTADEYKNRTTVFIMKDMDSPHAAYVKLRGEDDFRKIDLNGVVQ